MHISSSLLSLHCRSGDIGWRTQSSLWSGPTIRTSPTSIMQSSWTHSRRDGRSSLLNTLTLLSPSEPIPEDVKPNALSHQFSQDSSSLDPDPILSHHLCPGLLRRASVDHRWLVKVQERGFLSHSRWKQCQALADKFWICLIKFHLPV